ncbi:MAG: hypothetical protein HY511_09000, partial [Actinobacteria bacterium]|nr:hypothetical protein [Actinomycetota bacterium]
GELLGRDGRPLPPGTRLEAYVGNVLCGVASSRRTGNFSGYSLNVVGPEAVDGCSRGGTLSFRINGRRAAETATNEPHDPHQPFYVHVAS